jgi:CHAT domain-containing protein
MAFRALERGRARSFLDLLAKRDLRLASDLPPELARARRQTDVDYDRVQSTLGRLSPVRDQAEINRLLVQLRELRARREEIAAKVRQTSPRTAALQDPQPLDLAGARAALDPGTLLLAWSVGKERSFLFVVQPAGAPGSGLEVFSLSGGDQALRQRVSSFRNLLHRQGSDVKTIQAQARQLYNLLLRPAEARISTAQRLLVSPDGPLHILPFAALMRGERYLLEWKPIHSALSATIYAELQPSRPAQPVSGVGRLVAFGDPIYPPPAQAAPSDPEVREAIRRGLALKPLPATRRELEGIVALYPQAQAYVGQDATEERAKSLGPESRIVHFACHGLLDERLPLNSALALTIPTQPEEGQDNGLLQAWEILESVRLDADLVTLSACDTALGKEMGGEGLVGLTRAFQYAGARSVLASLWSISDDSTAHFMERFYGYLRNGKSKDEALRAAQIDQIRGKSGSSHPFHWAAFGLFGDWR